MKIIKEIQNGYKLVELSQADWQLYRDIRLEALELEPQAFATSLAKEKNTTEDKWRTRLGAYSKEHPSLYCFLQNDNGEIVGMAGAFEHEPGVVEMAAVYLKPKVRGLGLSKILINALINKISETGDYKKITTGVNIKQTAALHLYQKLGFEKKNSVFIELGDGKNYEVWFLVRYI